MTAEPRTDDDPLAIDWPARQAAAAIPFDVVNGYPVSPFARRDVPQGRNQMRRWGENLMADALVTATCKKVRHLLMVERGDGLGWAVPGGHADLGETALQAALRELAEETGLVIEPSSPRILPPRHIPDPRAGTQAWAVTIPVHIDLGVVDELPPVTGGDDARRAAWILAGDFRLLFLDLCIRRHGTLFQAHRDMICDLLNEIRKDQP